MAPHCTAAPGAPGCRALLLAQFESPRKAQDAQKPPQLTSTAEAMRPHPRAEGMWAALALTDRMAHGRIKEAAYPL
ncbi:hypothetical protein GCM10009771_11500 [Nesterenkonia flava]